MGMGLPAEGVALVSIGAAAVAGWTLGPRAVRATRPVDWVWITFGMAFVTMVVGAIGVALLGRLLSRTRAVPDRPRSPSGSSRCRGGGCLVLRLDRGPDPARAERPVLERRHVGGDRPAMSETRRPRPPAFSSTGRHPRPSRRPPRRTVASSGRLLNSHSPRRTSPDARWNVNTASWPSKAVGQVPVKGFERMASKSAAAIAA